MSRRHRWRGQGWRARASRVSRPRQTISILFTNTAWGYVGPVVPLGGLDGYCIDRRPSRALRGGSRVLDFAEGALGGACITGRGGDARPPFWQNLAELGWLGLHIDERHGGSGYGLSELVVVIEELGRAVAPGLFVPTVIASAVVAKEGTDDQRARLLPALIDGTLTAGVGLDSQVQVTDGVADGEAGIVLGAGLAELLLVAAGDDVLVLERGRKGVSVDVPENFDPTRRSGRVRLDNVRVTTDDILLGAYESALARARTLLAAEAVGGAADCVDSAVAYAKVRQQFGRTIATFQAVKHHCANMLVAAESAIAAVWDAARAAAEDEEQFRLAAAVAAALAFPAYARNAELNIQVHGGIGFTWEHDAHLHLRRALVTVGLFGGDAPVRDVFERTAAGVTRAISLDLPAQAEELRARIRSDAAEIAALEKDAQRDKLIETGYVMPHWPRPWGRAAGAVEQLVIEEEFSAAGIERPDYSITGWVILTLIQHGTPWQIERFVEKALRQQRYGANCSPNLTRGLTRPRSRPAQLGWRAAGRSTGKRCGPAERSTARVAWLPCVPIRMPPNTLASPR